MTQVKKIFRPPTSSNVCEIYELLREEGLIAFPLTQEAKNKVDSLVANITGVYFGIEPYPSPEEKAVAYLYFLIKDHPFTDGNKRTATLTFYVICRVNKLERDRSIKMDELAVAIEKLEEVDPHAAIALITSALFKKG